jgi:hypothetical protein
VDNRPSWEKYTAQEWALALQGLTPGGSEFLTPDGCAAWIRRSREFPPIIIRLRKEKALLRSALQGCYGRWDDLDEEDAPALGEQIRMALILTGGKV